MPIVPPATSYYYSRSQEILSKYHMDNFGLDSLGLEEMRSGAAALDADPSKYVNNADLEMQWAMKAYHHADTYFKLISTLDSRGLKLTRKELPNFRSYYRLMRLLYNLHINYRFDDEIYTKFKKEFPDYKLDVLVVEQLKTEDSKKQWRTFCNEFEKSVDDFNYGTLIRLDAKKDYCEENTILVTRIQFYAIEIARNREGYNMACYQRLPQT